MTTLVITGLNRDQAAALARQYADGAVHVETASDYDGVLAVEAGQASYYVGICQSGAGAALGLAIGILGSRRCSALSTPGSPPDVDSVRAAVESGVIAFGIPQDHVRIVIPTLVEAIAERSR
jgi:hypothetical protein